MITVWLGNHQPVDHILIGIDANGYEHRARTPVGGKRYTLVVPPADTTADELMGEITGGIWPHHSDADAPAWVACTDPGFGARLAAHYGCEQRNPEVGGADQRR